MGAQEINKTKYSFFILDISGCHQGQVIRKILIQKNQKN